MKFFIIVATTFFVGIYSFAGFENLVSLQANGEGNFDAVCSGLNFEEVGMKDLVSGELCGDIPVMNPIAEGTYVAVSGYTSYCDQRLMPNYSDGKLSFLTVTWLCSSTTVDYLCEGNVCSGSHTGSPSSPVITILSNNSYEYLGSSTEAIFNWTSRVAPSMKTNSKKEGPFDQK